MYREIYGTAIATNAAADATIIAAPAANRRNCITRITLQVYVAQSGGTDGVVAVEDRAGGDRIFVAPATQGVYQMDLGEYGWHQTAATLQNVTTDGGGTKASVRCTAFGYLRGV